jgi:hypothetical protein
VKSFSWVGMEDSFSWEMLAYETVHSLPSPGVFALLTASAQRFEPVSADLIDKLA